MNSNLSPKDREAFSRVATIIGALANPIRLEIIELLAQCERTVDALSNLSRQPVKTVSHHLQKLFASGLVIRRSQGRSVVYALADPSVATFWSAARAFAEERVTGLISRAGGTAAPLQEVDLSLSTLESMLTEERVTLIDVRPAEEFQAGHLPGALSVPLEFLEDSMPEFALDRPVVAYCRGRYCRLADIAVDILEASGFEATRFSDGVIEWRDAGHDVEGPENSSPATEPLS